MHKSYRERYLFSFCILLGIVGVIAVQYVRVRRMPGFVPKTSSFSLQPPSQAITGKLSLSTGTVQQFFREADGFREATHGGTIRQGESIETTQGTATITLGSFGSVSMDNNTQLSFINLVPTSLMLWQKSGTVLYEVNSSYPFSIRAGRSLITIYGDGKVSMTASRTTLSVSKGTATIGIVDEVNKTKVYNVIQGETARINNDQTVTIH